MEIIYGEDYLSSRNYLKDLIKTQINAKIEAKEIEPGELKQLLGNSDLFGTQPTIVIYGLFALSASKKKDLLIKILADSPQSNLILYEDKDINALTLKKFPKATLKKFEVPSIIFKFLDELKPNHPVDLPPVDPNFLFQMLIRQIRLLLSVSPNSKLPPWLSKKLINQKNAFGEKRLLELHRELYQIDKRQKTSSGSQDLGEELKNFFILV